jgi:hypothetical protein
MTAKPNPPAGMTSLLRHDDAASTTSTMQAQQQLLQRQLQQQQQQYQQMQRKAAFKSAAAASGTSATMPFTASNAASNPMVTSQMNPAAAMASSTNVTSSPGNAAGSTLRRQRKKKLPPSTEPAIPLPELDELTGKRYFPKKEYSFRYFDLLRFRRLKPGDYVAARTTSRDLWILARVLQDYPSGWEKLVGNINASSHPTAPLEFLQLSETRRDALFRDERVLIKDVDDKGDNSKGIAVTRTLILPLPRSFSEAAEWGSKYKKGFRVYAMYPMTTSLYSATVIDSTTYCRGDDDIIVVEFDGEEPGKHQLATCT